MVFWFHGCSPCGGQILEADRKKKRRRKRRKRKKTTDGWLDLKNELLMQNIDLIIHSAIAAHTLTLGLSQTRTVPIALLRSWSAVIDGMTLCAEQNIFDDATDDRWKCRMDKRDGDERILIDVNGHEIRMGVALSRVGYYDISLEGDDCYISPNTEPKYWPKLLQGIPNSISPLLHQVDGAYCV